MNCINAGTDQFTLQQKIQELQMCIPIFLYLGLREIGLIWTLGSSWVSVPSSPPGSGRRQDLSTWHFKPLVGHVACRGGTVAEGCAKVNSGVCSRISWHLLNREGSRQVEWRGRGVFVCQTR